MVSIAVIGPPTSGKSSTCLAMSGVTGPLAETCGVNYICTDVNGDEWHVWDTPPYTSTGWAGECIANEADVIVVCYDGRSGEGPLPLVKKYGVDRCVIALTRGARSYVSHAIEHLRTTRHDGSLVPISMPGVELVAAIDTVIRRIPVGSQVFYALE
jgi:GTPase SAR1 family protein